jgi:hypothetical protein
MDYVCEVGAQRNFEPWRDAAKVAKALDAEKEEEEAYNPMKALENRTAESKREMDILDALDEIRTRNARNERVDADAVIEGILDGKEEAERRQRLAEEEEDEAAVRAAFHDEAGEFVKRVADLEEGGGLVAVPGSLGLGAPLPPPSTSLRGAVLQDVRLVAAETTAILKRKAESAYGIVLKKKASPPTSAPSVAETKGAGIIPAPKASALALLGAYSASDSE